MCAELTHTTPDACRIEQSQLELEQIPFCMTSEVKKALAMHSVIAKQKGVYLLVRKVRVSFPYHTGTAPLLLLFSSGVLLRL
jgi:hypothetical protein